ncbi:hypothetical protein A2690_02670 [Candidatus Roizmanbacteria bacterium RIFCSPHIGHO2_01_FULL_39_12b]|uniref:LytR/CpsA/Psr regulator C-terminal domain-containing protein n=1 Tax=Candidatus Roizmanbacteria bacterium RIFCSPHIGHO2_01_FULL_39_12b TaxID=1802030 RepID=A0A1F7GBK3_9BACT|nr:MAG: hypothetical protein A2690_02670 [Candidatus Roizmanbacteria bacterium RIFCSPHIGHO2_01_FULL_39_12b]
MKQQRLLIASVVIFIIFYVLVLFWRGVENALLFQSSERINILLYGVEPTLISMGMADHVNYIIRFDNNIKTYAPGGYGIYGIGGLGKLSSLEKDPDLLRRAFSLMTGAHVDYHLYPKNISVYYETDFTKGFSPTKSALIFALFSSSVKSNARFLDKMFLFTKILGQRKIDYVRLKTSVVENDSKENLFDTDGFFKSYQGFFYKKKLRDDDASVQIQYKENYRAAKNIARVLDGEGIRVSDIDSSQEYEDVSDCVLRYKTSSERIQHSDTDVAIRNVLNQHCISNDGKMFKIEPSDSFDIVVVLSSRIEEMWR